MWWCVFILSSIVNLILLISISLEGIIWSIVLFFFILLFFVVYQQRIGMSSFFFVIICLFFFEINLTLSLLEIENYLIIFFLAMLLSIVFIMWLYRDTHDYAPIFFFELISSFWKYFFVARGLLSLYSWLVFWNVNIIFIIIILVFIFVVLNFFISVGIIRLSGMTLFLLLLDYCSKIL